ncbi:phospho-sugar mutase [Lachnospiraceae bacterium 54-53]
MSWKETYGEWTAYKELDETLKEELSACNELELEERFARNLSFGTGGLRGKLGAGTNRMNVYTVARTTRGFADYLLQMDEKPSCAIAYDSRNMSETFARLTACELAEKGVRVYLYEKLAPTPMLSYAVRYYGCSGGIVITASHNPGVYNGYKVYGPDGCQLTLDGARKVGTSMEPVSLRVVYTPLNGAGNIPVRKALKNYPDIKVLLVKEQELPDGNFPTCPYPNPETETSMELAAKLAAEKQADFFLATDPDCDRVGVGMVLEDGEKRLFTGNEIGVLLFDYICGWRNRMGRMPRHPVAVKTIVTTPMAEEIAVKYKVELRTVLTGFKFIGEQIGLLEDEKEEERFIFGFEESCGYLSGTHVRDKDGVNGALLICEMAVFYKSREKNLLQALEELYETYGYYENRLLSYEFSGVSGSEIMDEIMTYIRINNGAFPGAKVKDRTDYLMDDTGLPKSNVVSLILEDGSRIVIRPSGTEPKLKLYLMTKRRDREGAAAAVKELVTACNLWMETCGNMNHG